MLPKITFKGGPLTLVGQAISEGQAARNFSVVTPELTPVSLLNFTGKVKIFTTFPSIDTPVCDLQVKEFNKRAAGLHKDVAVVGISKDLPFAQKRFCEMFDIRNVTVVSDYKSASFGINYGLLIKELNLLARSVIIVDTHDIVRYLQVVPEITTAPDYDLALKKLEEVLKNPSVVAGTGSAASLRCKPCEGAVAALSLEKIEKLLAQNSGWVLVEGKKLVKEFVFKDFVEAKYFEDILAVIAEEQGHHPTLTLMYNKLKVTLSTHAAQGLTDNDFIMAKIIDGINS